MWRGSQTHLGDDAFSKDFLCPETGRESQISKQFGPNDPPIRQIGAARTTPSIEGTRCPGVQSRRKELDSRLIEFATGLEATGLEATHSFNTRGLPRHVLRPA